jgi:hypothetical protein
LSEQSRKQRQVRRIQPTGIPERTDLRIDAPASDPRTGEPPILTVVGEVKAVWNTELDTAMRTQLADRYMLDTGTTHGLYIVLWFDTGWWKAGISTDSAHGPETTGPNRHVSDNADTRTSRSTIEQTSPSPGYTLGIPAGQATERPAR